MAKINNQNVIQLRNYNILRGNNKGAEPIYPVITEKCIIDSETGEPYNITNGGSDTNNETELPDNIFETNEDGFFIVDENLNIGGYVTASGSNIITSSFIGETL